MMQKVLAFVLILLAIFGFLLFHDKGNEYLKPYVASYLETKAKHNVSVKIEHLKIELNYLELNAKLNNVANVYAKGKLSLLTQKLNLDYELTSDNLKNKMNINGTVKGAFNDIQITGKGSLLQSPINYDLSLKNDVLTDIKVNVNKTDIASLYGIEKADVNIDIANLNSKISEKPFQIDGVIKSSFATLKIFQTNYNANNKELSSKYSLFIPDASRLMFSSKQKLQGKVQVNGTFKYKNNQFSLTGKSKDLGGQIIFNLEENRLTSNMHEVEISKLLYFLGEKHYAKGKLTAEINLTDLKETKGTFNLTTQEAKTINRTLGKRVYFSLTANGDITPKSINIESKLNSDIFKLTSSDISYEIDNKRLNSSYFLEIPKLSKLNSLTGKELKGKLSVKGKVNYQDELLVIGSTKSLGGTIDFVFHEEKINAKINDISVEKLMKTFSYPQLFKAKLRGDFVYNLAINKGTFRSKLNQVELLNAYLAQVLREIEEVDLSKERYNQSHFNANFNKNLIDIDFEAKSNTILLSIPSGQINKTNNTIHANYKVEVGRKNVEGTIKGNISNPDITFDSSRFIQNNMLNVIEENIGKNETNIMKDMMHGFFR